MTTPSNPKLFRAHDYPDDQTPTSREVQGLRNRVNRLEKDNVHDKETIKDLERRLQDLERLILGSVSLEINDCDQARATSDR